MLLLASIDTDKPLRNNRDGKTKPTRGTIRKTAVVLAFNSAREEPQTNRGERKGSGAENVARPKEKKGGSFPISARKCERDARF